MKNKTSIIKVEKMLKINIGLKLLLCLPLIVNSYKALSDNRPKIEELAVFGVKLDYDADQVIEALTEYLSINEDELTVKKSSITNRVSSILYTSDQGELGIYLGGVVENADGELFRPTTGIHLDWEGDSDLGDKLEATLSEFSSPSIEKEDVYHQGEFRKTWCDTLNEAKDQCELNSDGMQLIRRDGRSAFAMGRG